MKHPFLAYFLEDLYKFSKLQLLHKASELCNELLGIYFDDYYELPDSKRKK